MPPHTFLEGEIPFFSFATPRGKYRVLEIVEDDSVIISEQETRRDLAGVT
jgi:hypothetical protein